MKSLERILTTIEGDAPVTDVRIGLRSTMVMSNHLGIAFTFSISASRGKCWRPKPGELPMQKSAKELAEFALSDDWTKASVGVAAINSLITPDPTLIDQGSGTDIALEKAVDASVVMVGHFAFAEKIRKIAKSFSILELTPRGDDLHASKASEVIPNADLVIITGTTLVNHTFDELAKLAEHAYVVLLGPTTILSEILFDYGVNAICGIRVTDPEQTINHLGQGGSFRHIQGVEKVTMLKDKNKT